MANRPFSSLLCVFLEDILRHNLQKIKKKSNFQKNWNNFFFMRPKNQWFCFWLYIFGIFFAFFCYTRLKYKNVCYTVLVIQDLFQNGCLYIFVIHGFSYKYLLYLSSLCNLLCITEKKPIWTKSNKNVFYNQKLAFNIYDSSA